jgi:5-methylcytosine-specific restriction protein A
MPERIPYARPLLSGNGRTLEEKERSAFYSSKRWARHRRSFLARHPLCVHCRAEGRIKAASIVHHVVDRLDDPSLAWDWNNFEALCSPCHTRHHNAQRARGEPDTKG